MDSSILTPNEVNNIGYVLSSILDKNALIFDKLYDNDLNGWDSVLFDEKCKFATNTVGVIRTNYNHIFVSYSMDHWSEYDNFETKNSTKIHSFFLNKSYESSPRILKDGNTYIFPNDFDCNLLNAVDDIKDIFTVSKEGTTDFPGNEKIQQFDTLPDCINIEQFEMYELRSV